MKQENLRLFPRDTFRSLLPSLVDLVFPPCCLSCQRPLAGDVGDSLCPSCDAAFEVCRRVRLEEGTRDRVRVGRTSVRVVASLSYEAPLDGLIHRFKYPGRGLAGIDAGPKALMCRLIQDSASLTGDEIPDAIIPVPLHRARLRQRGFNPATVLAKAVARERGITCLPTALARVRDTPSQTGLGRAQRRQNMAGAFRYPRKSPPPRSVWLVDDVVTTGATLAEAARTLRRAGVKRVVGLCIAKTPAPIA